MYGLDFDSYEPVERDAEGKVDSHVLVCIMLSDRYGEKAHQEDAK
jgi:hypothetical protein